MTHDFTVDTASVSSLGYQASKSRNYDDWQFGLTSFYGKCSLQNNTNSLADFVFRRFVFKQFISSNTEIVNYCCSAFNIKFQRTVGIP